MKYCAILGMALLGTSIGVAHAGTLAPSKPSDVVGAFSSGAACPTGGRLIDTRLLPDGSTAPLAIPAGRVLVVTGATITVDPDPMSFVSVGLSYGNSGYEAYGTSIECGTLGPPQFPQVFCKKELAVPNVVVKSGTPLCIAASNGILGGAENVGATVHGFLARDR